jgi:hypothetical protein
VTDASTSRSLRDAAALEPRGDGLYGVEISPFYSVVGRANGGYLQCVLAGAALAEASAHGATHVHPTAVSTNFISAPHVGAAEVRAQVRRVGRGASFVYVALSQAGELTTESLVTVGTHSDAARVRYQEGGPPLIAPLEECRASDGGGEINIMQVVDQRLDPAYATWRDGEVSALAEVRAWLRLNDGEASWDPWNVHFAVDAMPPATFPLGSTGWVPTLQLTSYVRTVPVGEWLIGRQWCSVVVDGLVDERCEVYDTAGSLVASASQLAMVRFGSGS